MLILGLNNGWYKVIYNGSICYIRSDYLSLTEIPYENQASPNSPKFYRLGKSTGVAPSAAALNGTVSVGSSASADSSSDSSSVGSAPAADTAPSAAGSDIVAEAQKYLGTPYVYGGASPSGFDCSGFVYYVLKQLGFSPTAPPADQYNQGTYVEKGSLQPGDIVFFCRYICQRHFPCRHLRWRRPVHPFPQFPLHGLLFRPHQRLLGAALLRCPANGVTSSAIISQTSDF